MFNHNIEGFGTYWRCYNLAKALALDGNEVYFFTFSKKIGKKLITIEKNAKNLTIIKVNAPYRLLRASIGTIVYSLEFISFIKDLDIVHIFAPAVPPTGTLLFTINLCKKIVKYAGVNIFLDMDDLWYPPYGFSQEYIEPLRSLSKALERYSYKSEITAITVPTLFLKKIVESLSKSNIPIIRIPNGVPKINLPALINRKIYKDVTRITMIGHTLLKEHFKQILLLIHIVNALTKKLKKVIELHIVSGNKILASLVKKEEPNVVFHGPKSWSEAIKILGSSTYAFIPYSSNPIDLARWPIRLGDYVALRKIILASQVSAEPLMLLKAYGCARLIAMYDVHLALKECQYLVTKPQEFYHNANFNAFIEKYSWRNIARNLYKIYKVL